MYIFSASGVVYEILYLYSNRESSKHSNTNKGHMNPYSYEIKPVNTNGLINKSGPMNKKVQVEPRISLHSSI